MTGIPFIAVPIARSAEQVDDHDDDRRDDVALDEFHGAVHRAVELAFALQEAPSPSRLVAVDRPRSEFGVDGHLLARHRVEREPRAHLGDALGPLCDDHELNDRENEEDHRADDVVAAHDERAEGADHLACVGLEKNEARRRDVQGEAEESREKQERREGSDADGVGNVEHHQKDGDGRRQVGRNEEIERPRRERDDHQTDDENDQRRERDVGEGKGAAPWERDGESALRHGGKVIAFSRANSRSTWRLHLGLYSVGDLLLMASSDNCGPTAKAALVPEDDVAPAPLRRTGHGRTDLGRKRATNEDAFFLDDQLGLYVVADGMGGHAAGEVASREAVDTLYGMVKRGVRGLSELVEPLSESDSRAACRLLEAAVQAATYFVYSIAEIDRDKSGMGTTISALLTLGDYAITAQVGDSRIYRIEGDAVEQLTEDHTLIAWQLKQGLITPQEAARSPHRNV